MASGEKCVLFMPSFFLKDGRNPEGGRKLLVTSASLVVTGTLLVVTRS